MEADMNKLQLVITGIGMLFFVWFAAPLFAKGL